MKSNYLKSLLTKDISYETDIPLIRKQLLFSKLLLIAIVIFSFLAIYHFFLTNDISLVTIDMSAIFAFLIASLALYKYNDFDSAVTISVLTLFIFITMFTLVNENSDYGLIWTIFFPLFSILTMGHKKGIIFVIFFYTAIFYLSYLGIDKWQMGEWGMTSFFHFAIASSVLVYTIYSVEVSHEELHKELNVLHEKETLYMQELDNLTVTDPLTSLHNRRHLDRVFKREFYHAKRDNHVMAFYILDIDFFKQYNDTYGHKEGDDALVKVSAIMKEHFRRQEDLLFRLGGEEFGGLITGQNPDEIENFISLLCVKITEQKIEHIGNVNQPILSVSIGINILENFEDDSFDEIYKNADLALYEAKQSGRDKAVKYSAT